MRKILVLGSGKSSVTLIRYLLDNAKSNNWFITVGDYSKELAESNIKDSEDASSIFLDVTNAQQREVKIKEADIVISMLPSKLHILVAEDCIRLQKNLITASYVSKEISSLHEKAEKAGVLLLNEVGLDPGIDHMSAMKAIDTIKKKRGKIISFKSFCGGLVHPDYDNNPWNYKFTWNPRNVVLAGQGTAQYIKNKKYKYIPYAKLFERTENIRVLDAGEFEGYANRDSLEYRRSYGLDDVETMLRGTLRKKGFCKSWNMFVQLGMTDDSYIIQNSENISYREFTNLFFPYNTRITIEDKFCDYLGISINSDEFKKADWIGIFTDKKVGIKNATPAQILQKILESRWSLNSGDKDMVVMKHQFEYETTGVRKRLDSSLLVYGDDQKNTAMAKTVGLPVAIAAKLILNGEIKSTGVKIPISKDIYIPILKELKDNGIDFIEDEF